VGRNLLGLLSPDPRLVFSAAPFEPWPAPWTWPLILLGALPALRKVPWLLGALAAASVSLTLALTSKEPHRLSVALLVLSAFAGVGAARLCRLRWGLAACLTLLLLGASAETRAYLQTPPELMARTYGDSKCLQQACRWLKANEPTGGWEILCGLAHEPDGDFRFLLSESEIRDAGKTPVALVPFDYAPALHALRTIPAVGAPREWPYGCARPDLVFGDRLSGYRLVFPDQKTAFRLRRIRDELSPLHRNQTRRSTLDLSADAAAWLQSGAHADPWARTVAWEIWLHTSLLSQNVDARALPQLLRERLVCAWAPDILSMELRTVSPELSKAFHAKADQIDPARRDLDESDRLKRY
jgi:hypothetical protein